MDKIRFREKYLKARKALSQNVVQINSICINKKLAEILNSVNIKTIAIYKPIHNEVIIDIFAISNYELYCIGNTKSDLNNWHLLNYENQLFNWNEISNKIDIILVPLVAFNKKGYRLGYGFGNYDKLLQNFSGRKIGLAYESQLLDINFQEEHDIALDLIITENHNYFIKK